MGLSYGGSRSETSLRCARTLKQSPANFPECRWVWRPPSVSITILNKHLTGLRPVLGFVSLGQMTATSLLTVKSMSVSNISSCGRSFISFLFFILFYFSLRTQLSSIWPLRSTPLVYDNKNHFRIKLDRSDRNKQLSFLCGAVSFEASVSRLFIRHSHDITFPLFRKVDWKQTAALTLWLMWHLTFATGVWHQLKSVTFPSAEIPH